MLSHRVIPVLLHEDDGLVKTRGFRDATYVGDPINAIRIFNEKEVDELALIDIERSKRGLPPNLELVERVASECFMPLSYGGGIRTVDDTKRLFSVGVEKVIVQGAALRSVDIVSEIADFSGSQSVTVAVDIRRDKFGKLHLYDSASGRDLARDWLAFIKEVQDAGAGEILLTSVANEGSMTGLDLELIASAARVTTVPLVVNGGVGSVDDIVRGIAAGADAVAVGSYFVFHGPRRGVLISYPLYSELQRRLGG